jgi:hypothetical protein
MSGQGLSESGRETERHRTFNRRSYLKTLGATSSGLALGGIGLNETEIESARAATAIIDDFEDGDLSEYNHDTTRDGRASIVSSPTYDGSYAMEINNENAELISTSGLAAYPAVGDTFSYWIRGTGGADDVNLSYGVQDHNNRYFVRVDIANNDLMLARYQSESITWLNKNTGGFTLSQDTWYEVEVTWSESGDHTATIYDGSGSQVAQVSASGDSTWTSGGIGYDAYLSSGEYVYFDYVTLGSSDGGSGGSSSPNGPDVSGGGLVVDNFEDNDLSEYVSLHGDSTIDGGITSGKSAHGSYSLGIEYEKLVSNSGLQNYPSAGTSFRYYFYPADHSNKYLYYGRQDDSHYYYISFWLHDDGDTLVARLRNGDTEYHICTGSITMPRDQWYEVRVDWGRDRTHSVSVYDLDGNTVFSESGTLPEDAEHYSSGGIGYLIESRPESGDGILGYYDSFFITDHNDSGEGVTVDDFEDGDLSEYSFDRGSSGASVVSSPTVYGSKALEISGTNTEMIKTTGLPNEPQAGDVFSYWVRGTNGADDINLTYGVQDHTNRYFVRVDFANDNLRLYRYEGSDAYLLKEQTSGFTLSEDVWYRVVVDWRTNGNHIVSLRTRGWEEQLEAMDSTWKDGGIGYDAYLGDGGTVYIDSVRKNEYRSPDSGCAIDDFEDGDLDEYTTKHGSPSIKTSPTYFGEYVLSLAGDTELVSTSGLSKYPTSGTRSRWRVRTGSTETVELEYGVQDTKTDVHYTIEINFKNDGVRLHYDDGSNRTTLARDDAGCILTTDEWFRVELDWRENGTHTVSVFNSAETLLTRISATDSSLSSGGVGYKALASNSDTEVFVDHVLRGCLGNRLAEYQQQHGDLQSVTTKDMSDNDGNPRKKTIHSFSDGTEKEIVHEKVSSEKLKKIHDSDQFWEHVPQKGINQSQGGK